MTGSNAFQLDPQMGSRYEPVPVPRWQMSDEFIRLLASFEVSTPLREPSDLAGDYLAGKLLGMSEGLIGELAELLRRAAVKAVRTRRERIDNNLLDSLGWVLPSQRRVEASIASD